MDSEVRHWLSLTVEDKSAVHEGLVMMVGRSLGMFNTYDGFIRLRDPKWIQGALNIPTVHFRRVGMMSNIAKSNTTTCHPGVILTWMSEEDFSWKITGDGATYQERFC